MANDWGQGAVNNNVGWGQAAVNNIAWGISHILSYSGQTNISGKSENKILTELPYLYMDSSGFLPTMFLSFRLADGIESRDINIDFYIDGSLSFNIPVSSGITQLWEFPPNGEYYVVLNVNLNADIYTFQSNTLTV